MGKAWWGTSPSQGSHGRVRGGCTGQRCDVQLQTPVFNFTHTPCRPMGMLLGRNSGPPQAPLGRGSIGAGEGIWEIANWSLQFPKKIFGNCKLQFAISTLPGGRRGAKVPGGGTVCRWGTKLVCLVSDPRGQQLMFKSALQSHPGARGCGWSCHCKPRTQGQGVWAHVWGRGTPSPTGGPGCQWHISAPARGWWHPAPFTTCHS